MKAATPPLPSQNPRKPLSRGGKLLAGIAIVPFALLVLLVILRLLGLLRPFSVPTGAMTPAVSAGDHVIMENITFLSRKPQRGDVVVFKTDGIASIPSATLYVKRIAGEPEEHLRISEGELLINGKVVALSNSNGKITYLPPPSIQTQPAVTDLHVPENRFFMLGDNSTNSFDSRYWGTVPKENILGRVFLCIWPPDRAGWVK